MGRNAAGRDLPYRLPVLDNIEARFHHLTIPIRNDKLGFRTRCFHKRYLFTSLDVTSLMLRVLYTHSHARRNTALRCLCLVRYLLRQPLPHSRWYTRPPSSAIPGKLSFLFPFDGPVPSRKSVRLPRAYSKLYFSK